MEATDIGVIVRHVAVASNLFGVSNIASLDSVDSPPALLSVSRW